MHIMDPIRFEPLLKRIRWGGTRLGSVLRKPVGPEADYAESWEISDHGDDQSIVSSGPLAGKTLQQLVVEHNEDLFGKHAGRTQFPLLIKYLDANDRLSVQVHPDDELARKFDPSENGKTEAWVIIAADPGSRLYAGLKDGVDAASLRQSLAEGTIEDCLHSFEVAAGDCVFIPAGTVHAIAEGILLAEIQQSSDLTFRLHDWGRLGADGQPRELHIEESFRCIDFDRGPVAKVASQRLTVGEELVNSKYFTIRRYAGPGHVPLIRDNQFHVLQAVTGNSTVICGGTPFPLRFGETLLLPANRAEASIESDVDGVVLDTYLPE
jgi:mannose-6-phosphate isomerase